MLSEIAMEFEISNGMKFGMDILTSNSKAKQSDVGIIFDSGLFGSNPYAIDYYLNAHKQIHFSTKSLSELESWKKPGRVFIVSCWNDKDHIKAGLHTFAVIEDSIGDLYTYNGYDTVPYSSFSDIFADNCELIVAYYLP